MKNNGLLTSEQLEDIFQNLEDLIEVNKQFTDRLHQTVEAALVAGDEVTRAIPSFYRDMSQSFVFLDSLIEMPKFVYNTFMIL